MAFRKLTLLNFSADEHCYLVYANHLEAKYKSERRSRNSNRRFNIVSIRAMSQAPGKRILLIAALFGLAILATDGCGKRNAAAYQTISVTHRDINSTVTATGIIKPMVGAEVKVGSRISGIVTKLYANIGAYVTEGQPIAQLDTSDLKTKLMQNEAALIQARAGYDYALSENERQKALAEKSLISRQEFDVSFKAFTVAEAQLKQAQANLESAKIQFGYARITAPIAGVVASVSTQEGEVVSASFSAPTFVTIINLRKLEVHAYVDETDIGKIVLGQQATFTVDTYAETDFKGTVTAIYPDAVIQDNVVNYIVTIKINDFQGKTLRPEMTANVALSLGVHKNVLAVPTSAIKRGKNGKFVLVADGKTSTARPVKIGWKDTGYTEIISGLKEGEKIIVSEANGQDI